MARGTRDVELVVKARNEASKSLDAITSALDDLTKAQAATAKGSETTGSTLARLGSELQKLTTQLTASTGVDKLSASMDKASAAVTRMEASLTKAAEEAVKLDTSIDLTQDSISRMAANAERLKNVLTTQKGATASAKEEFSKLAAELKAGEAALAGSAKKSQQYIDTLGKQEGKLSKLEQEHQKYRDAILYVVEPTAKLISNFEKTDAALRKQVDLIARTKAEYGEFSGRIKELSATVPALRSAVAASEASFNAAASAQRNTEAALRGVDKESKSAAINLAKLKDAAAANAESLARQSTSLDQAKVDLVELGKAAEQARLKTSQLDNMAFKRVADDAARLNKASEYVRWWEQALEAADKAEDRLAANSMGNINGKAAGYNAAAQAARNMGNASRDAAMGVGEIEEKGRAAMSWSQRFRGELVALTLSFVGVYAAITQLRNVMKTVVEMDAAQTRLGVAFGEGQGVIAKEMKFVQAEADRLGISVKVLAAEYSKLAIATKDTSLAGDETRRIFVSLSEAFRVGNLTQNQMELALNAISQMVNKGSVSMEELRQQLGERLAGAFNLAAQAAGYTTEEFAKLVAEGKIATETFLPKLADQLDKTFGPGLSAALSKVGADIGKFENNIVKAQMAFADGGFTKGLQEALKILNEQLSSKNGTQFFRDLGAIVGSVVQTMAEFTKYGHEVMLVLAAMSARLGVKAWEALALMIGRTVTNVKSASAAMQATAITYDALGTPVQRLGVSIGLVDKAILSMNMSLAAARAQAGATTASIAILQGAVNGAARAVGIFRGVLAGLGGIPGLIITGLTVALTEWWMNSKRVVDVMGEHQRQMDAILQAYDDAAKKGGKWVDSLKGVTTLDIKTNLEDMLKEYTEQREKALRGLANKLGGLGRVNLARFGDLGVELKELIESARAGGITMTYFREQVAKLAEQKGVPTEVIDALKEYSKAAAEAADKEIPIAKLDKILKEAGITATGVSPAIKALGVDIADLGSAGGEKIVDPIKKVEKAIKDLRGQIGQFKEADQLALAFRELDRKLEELGNDKNLDKTSDKFRELIGLVQQAKGELITSYISSGKGNVVDRIIGVESGGKATAKNPNSTATGLGQFISSTFLEMFKKYFPDTARGMADADILELRKNADVSRRLVEAYATENAKLLHDAGVAVTDASIYLAHFLGPKGALSVLQAKADTPVSKLLGSDVIKANAGILSGKTAGEVIAWAQQKMGVTQAELEVRTKISELEAKSREDAKKKVEDNEKYNDDLKAQLATKQAELEAEGKLNALPAKDQFVAVQVQEEVNKAKKAGRVLDEDALRMAAEVAGLLWEQKNAQAEKLAIQKEQQVGEEKISRLTQLRRDLLQQLEVAQGQGDTDRIIQLRGNIESVTTKLREAIQAMIAFWDKSGDTEKAEAAKAALKVQEDALVEVGHKAYLTAINIDEMFSNLANSSVDTFLNKIRETGDVLGALKTAFQSFVSDFLLGLAKMIMQQAIFNAMQAAGFGKPGGGFIGSSIMSLFKFHSGGVVGQGGQRTYARPEWFSNAVRYHSGGIAGLKPNEVPALLQQGEEVLTASDPRHVANGGGAGGVKIINTIDSGSMVSEGLSTSEGEKAIFNFVRANKASLKQVLA